MHCHPTVSAGDVRRVLGAYFKMAPYRQGGAGKGATLMEGDASPTHTSSVTSPSARDSQHTDSDEADC